MAFNLRPERDALEQLCKKRNGLPKEVSLRSGNGTRFTAQDIGEIFILGISSGDDGSSIRYTRHRILLLGTTRRRRKHLTAEEKGIIPLCRHAVLMTDQPREENGPIMKRLTLLRLAETSCDEFRFVQTKRYEDYPVTI